MYNLFFNQVIFVINILGFGLVFCNFFRISKYIEKVNIFDIALYGIVFIGFFAQLLNFFIPLNDILIILSSLVSLILILFFFKDFKKSLNFGKITILFILAFYFLTILTIYGSGYSDDLNHYHYGYINNIDNFNYIFGLNFLHHHYGFSPLWLSINAFLNFENTKLQDIHLVNSLPFFLILSTFFVKILDNIKNKKITLVTLIQIFFCFFLLLKYTRLKEFGVDRPAFIFFIYFFYLTSKIILENNIIINNRENQYKLYVLLILSLFIFFTKITFISLFLIPFFVFLLIKNININYLFNFKFLIIFLIFISYLLKNLILSGCLIYPISFTCLEQFAWNSKEISNILSTGIEAFNKNYNNYRGELGPIEFIKNFNWIDTWYLRIQNELKDFLLLKLLILILTISLVKFTNSNLSKANKNKINLFLIILLSLFLFSFFILFLKTPVIRMSHHVFLLFFILIFSSLYKFFDKNFLIKKNFLFIFFILCILFSMTKNFNRISKAQFVNNPKEHILKMKLYSPSEKNSLNDFDYYVGNFDGSPIGNTLLDKNKYYYKKNYFFNMLLKK